MPIIPEYATARLSSSILRISARQTTTKMPDSAHGIGSVIHKAFLAIIHVLVSAFEAVGHALGSVFGSIGHALHAALQAISNGVKAGLGEIGHTVTALFAEIRHAFAALLEGLWHLTVKVLIILAILGGATALITLLALSIQAHLRIRKRRAGYTRIEDRDTVPTLRNNRHPSEDHETRPQPGPNDWEYRIDPARQRMERTWHQRSGHAEWDDRSVRYTDETVRREEQIEVHREGPDVVAVGTSTETKWKVKTTRFHGPL